VVQCTGHDFDVAKIVSIVVVVCWVVGLPVGFSVLLFLYRNSLHELFLRRILGGLYLKYKNEYYFWDVIILVRRIVIVTISMLKDQPDTRSFLLLLAMLGSVMAHRFAMPFKDESLNKLELLSLLMLLICTLFLDSHQNGFLNWVVLVCGLIFALATLPLIMKRVKSIFVVLIKKLKC